MRPWAAICTDGGGGGGQGQSRSRSDKADAVLGTAGCGRKTALLARNSPVTASIRYLHHLRPGVISLINTKPQPRPGLTLAQLLFAVSSKPPEQTQRSLALLILVIATPCINSILLLPRNLALLLFFA